MVTGMNQFLGSFVRWMSALTLLMLWTSVNAVAQEATSDDSCRCRKTDN